MGARAQAIAYRRKLGNPKKHVIYDHPQTHNFVLYNHRLTILWVSKAFLKEIFYNALGGDKNKKKVQT